MIKMKYRGSVAIMLATMLALLVCCGFSAMRASATAPVFGASGSGETDKGGATATYDVEVTEDSLIPQGVFINETPVGGMSIREARAQLETLEEQIRQSAFTVTQGENTLVIPFEEVGLVFEDTTHILFEAAKIGQSGTLLERYKALKDLQNDKIVCTWGYDFSVEQLEEKVAAFADVVYVEMLDATIARVENEFVITDEQIGLEMDTEATLKLVREAVKDWNGESASVEAVTVVLEPERTAAALSTITEIMADFVTPMGGDVEQGRGWNVVLGAEKMNGVVLMPGESYSAWERLQPFTKENGWQYATAFNQGGYVDDLGGGVCSLTTTLYNAIMYAELQVDRRYNHSMVINYARPGFDSTVNNDGSKDLVFTNPYDFPIYIEARAWAVNPDYGQCYFAIWGTRTEEFKAKDISLYYEVIEQEDAVYNYFINPELEPGTEVIMQSAYPYMVVEAYKKVEIDGEVVSDEYLYTDTYIRSDGIIHHNPIEQ